MTFSVLLTLALVEGFSQVAYWLQHGRWKVDRPPWGHMFSGHPFLVVVPTPSATVTVGGNRISHNALGLRGPEVARAKPPRVVRIATLGASTTYCTGVDDSESWQVHLAAELGEGYEVVNFGVPGYTTIENLIQTATWLSDFQPDAAVYYVGWADAQNQHVADLEPDYSGYHGRSQFSNMLLDQMRPAGWSAALFYLKGILDRLTPGLFYLSAHAEPGQGAFTPVIDRRALGLYRRNLHLIATLCRQQEIVPVFVPQVLNYERLDADRPYGWLPFVNDEDLRSVIGAYNRALAEVAAAERVALADEVLAVDWKPAEFVDQGHFSPHGTRKFAHIIALTLKSALGGAESSSAALSEGVDAAAESSLSAAAARVTHGQNSE